MKRIHVACFTIAHCKRFLDEKKTKNDRAFSVERLKGITTMILKEKESDLEIKYKTQDDNTA